MNDWLDQLLKGIGSAPGTGGDGQSVTNPSLPPFGQGARPSPSLNSGYGQGPGIAPVTGTDAQGNLIVSPQGAGLPPDMMKSSQGPSHPQLQQLLLGILGGAAKGLGNQNSSMGK